MVVKILYGFDTERPWGPDARKDPEKAKAEREANLGLISIMGDLMNKYNAGRTFFILGDYIDLCEESLGKEHLRQVFQFENNLVEIGQHTYNHVTVAPIATRPDRIPVTADELRSELEKANSSLHRIFGVKAIGLRIPLGYAHKVLLDHPNITTIMKESGLEYVSSSLRSSDWGINAPLRENGKLRQPFAYFNGLIEIPSHGWQDSAFTETSKTKGTEDFPTTTDGIMNHYTDLMNEAEIISQENGRDIYVGMCMHPWAIRRYDNNLEVISRLLDFASNKGFESVGYGRISHEFPKIMTDQS